MKGKPVDQLVYEYMFPKARPTDPQNFHSLLHRHLILEVRQEVHSFYGHLDTQEAKYPGLDYCNRIHRIRLGRWAWHRRLFRAFDGLRLTNSEISNLTKWEGTKWAKERFERDSGIIIRDTAADDLSDWVEPEDRPRAVDPTVRRPAQIAEEREVADDDMEGEEESDGELESIGIPLNERLRERAARREAGDISEPLDEEWELWLKNAIENGQLPFLSQHLLRQSDDRTLIPTALFPPRMLSAARAGQWHEVPEFLQEMLRRTLEAESVAAENETASGQSASEAQRDYLSSSLFRRTYSDLRLPVGDGGPSTGSRLHRTAQPGI